MPRLSINDAAKLCRKARSTLQRAVQQGRLVRGLDGLLDTADLVREGYLDAAHEHDPIPRLAPITLRQVYELNVAILALLQTISQQLTRLLALLEPSAGQPTARPKKRPPGTTPQPCC